MSDDGKPMTVPRFVRAKATGRKLVMLTAYDFLWARLLDEAGVDALLVGDSLGMVVQGRPNTLAVTLEEMLYHARLVTRAVRRALVIVDMPFLSYQVSVEEAVRNAGRILKETGAPAVKLESGAGQARTIAALTQAGIPVMAHIGMRPQAVHLMGGMGRIQRDAERLLADAKEAVEAGAFGVVLELIPAGIARRITEAVPVPTIGIGAGPHCDGQVLVTPDMLGLTEDFRPKFVKRFAELAAGVRSAIRQYAEEVRAGTFPGPEHTHDG